MFNDSKAKPGIVLLPLPWEVWVMFLAVLGLGIGVWFWLCYFIFHVRLGWL